MSFTTTAMTTDIQSLILDELRAIRGDIKDIKTDVSQLKADVSQLKTDVSALKTAQEQTDLKIVGINNDINTMKGDIADMKTKFDTRMTGFETELGTMNNKLVEGRYIRRSFLTEGWSMPVILNMASAAVAAVGGYNIGSKQKCDKCE